MSYSAWDIKQGIKKGPKKGYRFVTGSGSSPFAARERAGHLDYSGTKYKGKIEEDPNGLYFYACYWKNTYLLEDLTAMMDAAGCFQLFDCQVWKVRAYGWLPIDIVVETNCVEAIARKLVYVHRDHQLENQIRQAISSDRLPPEVEYLETPEAEYNYTARDMIRGAAETIAGRRDPYDYADEIAGYRATLGHPVLNPNSELRKALRYFRRYPDRFPEEADAYPRGDYKQIIYGMEELPPAR